MEYRSVDILCGIMSEEQLVDARYKNKCANIKWDKLVKKRVPIVSWLPEYTLSKFLQDVLAGISVGLTEIPQGIAYAIVAGLEPQYGLYSGFMGCFVYAIFGSCKDINIGPTAIMALMIQPYVEILGPSASILMSFLSGCIILALGVLQLGFVVQFFSYPVISGFTSAAALQIASSQLNGLLGIPKKANEFLDAWTTLVENISQTKLWDTLLGVTCILLLTGMKELKRFGGISYNPQWSTNRNIFGRAMWLTSLGRNALLVILSTLMSYLFISNGHTPFVVTGALGKGMPSFQAPNFTIEYNDEIYSFGKVVQTFGGSIAFIPLVCILESIAIGKAFSKGKTLDATQEMIAVGLSNLMGSFVGSMPVTGSFTRTAVNNASGVQTTLGGVITGSLVLLALALLTSTFYYIPKATLAAVVISAMFYLFDFEAIQLLWKSKKLDLIPFTVTLISSLFLGLEYGILIGIGTNLLFVLYTSSRPPVDIDVEKLPEGEVFIVTPSRDLQFPAAEYVKEKVMKDCNAQGTTIVLNGKYMLNIDATVAKNLKTLADDVVARKQKIVFWNFKPNVNEVCIGVDSNLCRYFRAGNLEDIIDNPALARVDNDCVYTIQ